MKGKFIVLEGIDGSGTTTQAAKLGDLFKQNKNYHVLLTREPGLSEPARRIREKLLSGHEPKQYGQEYLGLFVADRAAHLEFLIKPALNYGVIVVCDRYYPSTLTYQTAQEMKFEEIASRHKNFQTPDLVLILDVPVETAKARLEKEGRKTEAFEEPGFMEAVRQNYLKLKEDLESWAIKERVKEKENIIIIDGTKPIEEVHGIIVKYVNELLKDFTPGNGKN